MMGTMFGSGGYGFFGMWWIMIIFWLLVIIGAIGLIKWVFTEEKSEIKRGSALDILKERYAKGEINEDEYNKKKKDLINS
ncbi:SHOCT domain-containing protein [Patescibacteria group bacterium]|nr:SHOCT domain-containing protein [Patescibacteria group bacterium]